LNGCFYHFPGDAAAQFGTWQGLQQMIRRQKVIISEEHLKRVDIAF
jgi:hypothetical protein